MPPLAGRMTDNERHLMNVLDWRIQERDDARAEVERLHARIEQCETEKEQAESSVYALEAQVEQLQERVRQLIAEKGEWRS